MSKYNKYLKKQYILLYLFVGIAIYALILYSPTASATDKAMSVKYYDKNGNPISTSYSIVSGTPDVAYISFDVVVKNTGDVPITSSIAGASPLELQTSLSNSSAITIQPEQTGKWTSGLIQTKQFENSSKTFEVTINSNYQAGNVVKSFQKKASVILNIISDVNANFDVGIAGSTGVIGTGVNGTSSLLTTGSACTSDSACQSGKCSMTSSTTWLFTGERISSSPSKTIICSSSRCRLVNSQYDTKPQYNIYKNNEFIVVSQLYFVFNNGDVISNSDSYTTLNIPTLSREDETIISSQACV